MWFEIIIHSHWFLFSFYFYWLLLLIIIFFFGGGGEIFSNFHNITIKKINRKSNINALFSWKYYNQYWKTEGEREKVIKKRRKIEISMGMRQKERKEKKKNKKQTSVILYSDSQFFIPTIIYAYFTINYHDLHSISHIRIHIGNLKII